MLDKLLREDLSLKDYRNWLVKSIESNDVTTVSLLEKVSDSDLKCDSSEQVSVIKEARKLLFFNRLEEKERVEKVLRNREIIDAEIHNNAKRWWI